MSKNTIITDSKWFVENAIERDFLEANGKAESLGRIHKPIPHWEVLEKFRNEASSRGLALVNEQGRLHKDGMRYMFTAEIEDPSHPDYNMSVGFINHNDRSKAFVGALGSQILVCCNLLITNMVIPSKQRHTTGNYDLIGDKVRIIFDKFATGRQETADQIELLKHTRLTDDILGRFVLEAHKLGTIGAANIFKMVDDVITPELNDRSDSSLWRLSNACTKVATHIIRSPEKQAETSKNCHEIIMKLADPTYRPAFFNADAIDVEAEVVQA